MESTTSSEALAYFNYSIILPNPVEETKETLVLGHLVIKNNGNTPLHSPTICIRIKPTEAGSLGGKINFSKREDFIIDGTSAQEWVYLDKSWREKIKKTGEHWLRPVNKASLHPNESLQFANFDLRCQKAGDDNFVIIEAFIYFKELQAGIASLNKIVINF